MMRSANKRIFCKLFIRKMYRFWTANRRDYSKLLPWLVTNFNDVTEYISIKWYFQGFTIYINEQRNSPNFTIILLKPTDYFPKIYKLLSRTSRLISETFWLYYEVTWSRTLKNKRSTCWNLQETLQNIDTISHKLTINYLSET